MLNRIYGYRLVLLVLLQIGLIALANQTAFWLRFDGDVPNDQQPVRFSMLPLLIVTRLVVFMPLRLHSGVWRYASLWDLRNIILAVLGSSILFYSIVHLALGVTVYPRSIFIIDAGLLICMMGGLRMSRRIYREMSQPAGGRRLLIYGAGNAGEMIVRDMRHNPEYNAWPVGFIDDDRRLVGQRIHGVPVLGTREALPRILERANVDEILIAIPSGPPRILRSIVEALSPYKIRISTLPRLSSLVGQQVGFNQIRELRLEDLLARSPVALDYLPVHEVLNGKRVLVTGAGGSIGSELCRQIAHAGPETLILLDQYENSLYTINNELADAYSGLKLKSLIGDITDSARMNQVLATHRPDVVFHAAAHKHVPLMEDNPCEAIKNNVRGTRLLAEAAAKWGVARFVMVSTDKAVNPTSVMGAAKRVAELVVKSLDAVSNTQFTVVRFGNVLGSNGSVVPRFLGQIANGGPVTVTHPEMRRYFMLIPEAVQLVLHAATIDDRGCIFVLDMGEQVRVADMARDMIRLSGYIPEQEIAITYTGIRPGEKLYEELIADGEHAEPSRVPKIMKVNGAASAPDPRLANWIAALEHSAIEGRDDEVIEHLCGIVPSFTPLTRSGTLQSA